MDPTFKKVDSSAICHGSIVFRLLSPSVGFSQKLPIRVGSGIRSPDTVDSADGTAVL